MQHQINIISNRLSKLETVKNFTGLSKSSIYGLIKSGLFPAPVRTGKRAVAWRAEDLESWINSRPPTTLTQSNGEKS